MTKFTLKSVQKLLILSMFFFGNIAPFSASEKSKKQNQKEKTKKQKRYIKTALAILGFSIALGAVVLYFTKEKEEETQTDLVALNLAQERLAEGIRKREGKGEKEEEDGRFPRVKMDKNLKKRLAFSLDTPPQEDPEELPPPGKDLASVIDRIIAEKEEELEAEGENPQPLPTSRRFWQKKKT